MLWRFRHEMPNWLCAHYSPVIPRFRDWKSPLRDLKKHSWRSRKTTTQTQIAKTDFMMPGQEMLGYDRRKYEHNRSGSQQHPNRSHSSPYRDYLSERSKV